MHESVKVQIIFNNQVTDYHKISASFSKLFDCLLPNKNSIIFFIVIYSAADAQKHKS